ncbi:hypothetical protein ACGYQ5_14295 [Burkholderia pseudomallei]
MSTTETEEQRIERLRAQNVAALKLAGHLIIANEDFAVQVLCELMNAPSKEHAAKAVYMTVTLIAHLARQMRIDDNIRELKPDLNS